MAEAVTNFKNSYDFMKNPPFSSPNWLRRLFRFAQRATPGGGFLAAWKISGAGEAGVRRGRSRDCLLSVRDRARSDAVSLLELLVVIGIMLALAVLLAPPATALMRSMSLTQAGQVVLDQFSYARQAALSRNRTIEIRFYQFGDPETPGESSSNPSGGKFRGFQMFEISEHGVATPIRKFQRLPKPIIIDSGDTLSSILSRPTVASGSALNFPIPIVGTSYNCISIFFQPDGTPKASNLTSSDRWFLTLHCLSDGDRLSAGAIPSNFLTLQIEAANGHFKIYRPGT